jgi:hypothetical protein
MRYSLEELVTLARKLEPFMEEIGCHVAIGGSCLHKGGSDKDMDLYIYPHKDHVSKDVIAQKLLSIGFKDRRTGLSKSSRLPDVLPTTDSKLGRRIDFFFLERPVWLNKSGMVE